VKAAIMLARGNYLTIAREHSQAIPEILRDLESLRRELMEDVPLEVTGDRPGPGSRPKPARTPKASRTDSTAVPTTGSGQTSREAGIEKKPILQVGHPIIEELAKLWGEWDATDEKDRVRRFQQILDRFHRAKSLDSFELNKSACQWVNQIAAKKDIKLMLNGTVAVRLRCAPRGNGYFAPLRAKRGGPPIPGAGSKNFPSLTAMPI
jgi:hypothetical protein